MLEQQFNEWKERMKDMPIQELAAEMMAIRKELDDAKDAAAGFQQMWDHLRIQLLPEKMEDAGLENARISGIGTITLATDAWVSTKNSQELFKWLEEHEHGDLITETVNPSTLKAFLKEQLRNGEEVPSEEVVKFTPYTYAKITNTKKANGG